MDPGVRRDDVVIWRSAVLTTVIACCRISAVRRPTTSLLPANYSAATSRGAGCSTKSGITAVAFDR
jgi:hypothetical protein